MHHMLVPSGSRPLPRMSNDRPSSSTNDTLPSTHTTYPNPQFPTTQTTSATPINARGTHADPRSMHSHVQNSASRAFIPPPALALVIGTLDNTVRGRLSTFEESLKSHVDLQKRINTSFISEMNTKMAEEQAAISRKLDDFAHIYQQNPGQLMHIVRSNLSTWQETMVDHVKDAIKGIGEDVMKNVEAQIDEKKLRTYFSAAGHLAIKPEGKAAEQRHAIESTMKEVQMSNLSLHSRLDSFDARMQSIEDILATVASHIANSTPTAAQPSADTPPTCDASPITNPQPPKSPISTDLPVSIVTHEILTSSFASLQSKFTEYLSHAEDMMARLAKTTNIAREESYAGKEELANMIDTSHDIQTAQMENLREEVSAVKAAIGVDTFVTPTVQWESSRSSEFSTMNTSENYFSQKFLGLAERLLSLEADHQELMQHYKNTTSILRESADASLEDKGMTTYPRLINIFVYFGAFEKQVSEYLTLSLYSDIPTLDTDTIGAGKGVIFDSTVPQATHLDAQHEEPLQRKSRSISIEPLSRNVYSSRSRPPTSSKPTKALSPAWGPKVSRTEGRLTSFPRKSAHPSNAGIGESSADELQTEAPNVHSSESEALPASPSSSRSQSTCKHSPLMSDSGDDYVPSTEKKSKRMYPELVCTRLSSGKQPKFVVNLNSHVARKLCPDLKAAREEEDCNSRAPQRPRAGIAWVGNAKACR